MGFRVCGNSFENKDNFGSEVMMLDKNRDEGENEYSPALDRQFKYAVIVYAIVEFIAIVFIVYYKATR